MSFRARILAEVKRQGLSGYRLAKLSGVALRTTQEYLSGDADISGERVAKLADALGLELVARKRPRPRRKGS